MPRKAPNPGTISYTHTELLLSIIKALMLRRDHEEGYTARELATVLHTDADRVGRILTQLHSEYGLVWISGWKRYTGQMTGSASRSFSISTSGPFMHVDRPKPHPMSHDDKMNKLLTEVPRVSAKWPEVVDYIKRNSKYNKFPTYQQVQDALGVSPPTVAKAIKVLRAQQLKAA